MNNTLTVTNTTSSVDGKIPTTSTPQLYSTIKFVGMPLPGVVDTKHALGPGYASSRESAAFNALAFPALEQGQSAKDQVVGTIDASDEDPFTIESFENLIQLHTEKGKDFIIARVATVEANSLEDLTGSEHLYYSFYAAHHINKVLFRTQPSEGLLHRMKAKNVCCFCLGMLIFE